MINDEITECHTKLSTKDWTLEEIQECRILFEGEGHSFSSSGFENSIGKLGLPILELEFGLESVNYRNGYYYSWLCGGPIEFNGVLLKTKDFCEWEYVYTPDFETKASCEIVSVISGDFQYIVFRRVWKESSLILAKYDMINNCIVDYCIIPDCTSRPWISRIRNELYLFHSLGSRDCVNVIRIDQHYLKRSWQVLSMNGIMCQYFTPVQGENGQVYTAFTTMGEETTRVVLSHFTLQRFTPNEIDEKLLKLFME